MSLHQYVRRIDGAVLDEELFADRIVRFLYSQVRENASWLFRALTGARASSFLALLNFDLPFASRLLGNRRFLERCGVDLAECADPIEHYTTPRRVFERRIRYWDCRPLPEEPRAILSPADARVVVGSLRPRDPFFLKGKFFAFEELVGSHKTAWLKAFDGGEAAVFRLTPDKYHYNHCPVSGQVVDFYELSGAYHACNPSAIIALGTPHSKNRRVVTIIDTDVPGGTGIGFVAMVEVVALMIGDIAQAYSEARYEYPQAVGPGLFLRRGQPKSLYRPGSSTDILLFQPDRVRFDLDLQANQMRGDAASRFTLGFNTALTETEVLVRSQLALPR
jgi:phosphatidylserine decarboxylase